MEDEKVVTVPSLPESERVGRMLKGLRLREGMTQLQLAKAIGVPQSPISEYEKNKRTIPPAKAEELATLLHTVPGHFLYTVQRCVNIVPPNKKGSRLREPFCWYLL